MKIKEMAQEAKMNLLYIKWTGLWNLSVRLKKPVYSWAWKSSVYKKRNRDKLWDAYCRDVSNMA